MTFISVSLSVCLCPNGYVHVHIECMFLIKSFKVIHSFMYVWSWNFCTWV